MKRADQATDLVRRTEDGLRQLAADSIASGDYEVGIRLSSWAKTVGGLLTGVASASANEPLGVPYLISTDPEDTIGDCRRASSSERRAPNTRCPQARKRKNRASTPKGYPRFIRRADSLIKIGWSKRSKEEYQHKAPQKVVFMLADNIAGAGTNGRLVTVQDLVPMCDPADKSTVPDYQTYLCLAWLRENRLLNQHGRQGYTVADPKSFGRRVAEAWDQTPQG